MLQNNVDERLWLKALEECEEFSPLQQGGPLMLQLILKRIQNSSESSCEHIKTQLMHLNISKIPGENVETAVSIIKSSLRPLSLVPPLLTRHSFPMTFPPWCSRHSKPPQSLLSTGSLLMRLVDLRRDADVCGGQPQWRS